MAKKTYANDPTHGKVVNPNSKYQRTANKTGPITWAEVDGPTIKSAIHAITRDGAAVVFGRTSDGGALSLTLLDGAERIKKWPNSAADAETILLDWLEAASTPEPV